MPRNLRWSLTAIVPLAIGVATLVAQRASGVTMFDDEMGFLGEAVALSARHGQPVLDGIPFYSAGYPLLLAGPLSVTRVDPWMVAVGTNLALMACLGPILHAMVRRLFPIGDAMATLAAIAGASVPSVVAQVPRAWSEVALAVGMAGWALALLRFTQRPGALTAAVLGGSTGLVFALHRRSLVLVGLTVVALVVSSVGSLRSGRRGSAGSLVAGLAALAVSLSCALALDAYVTDRLYGGETSGSRLDRAEVLRSTVWVPTLLGHAWSGLTTTFGLVALGLIALGVTVGRRQHALWAGTVLVAFGGLVMTSVLFLGEGSRADQTVYERYMATMFPVVVAIGVGWLGADRRRARLALLVAAGSILVSGVVLDASVGRSRLVGPVQKFTVPTLSGLDVSAVGWGHVYTPAIHVLPITAIACLAALVIAFTARRPTWAAGTTLGTFVLALAVVSAGSLRPFANEWEPTARDVATILRDNHVRTLSIDRRTPNEVRNAVQYRLGYPPVITIDLDAPDAPCPDRSLLLGPPHLENSYSDLVPLLSMRTFPGVLYEADCSS